MDDPRYPVGPFEAPTAVLSPERRVSLVDEIERTPAALRATLSGLGDDQLDTPYRPGGWTLRQVAHHVADSHMNAYIRFRFALTEDEPTIKPYDEARWAELHEARTAPVEVSVALLESLHRRFVLLLRALSPAEWARPFRHPDHGRKDLDWMLAMYAWHGRHHTGHVSALRKQKGW